MPFSKKKAVSANPSEVFAPAKVNLALHVTGRRDDGYHLLDSLVVFAGVGDWLDMAMATELSLSVSGPRAAGVPTDRGNLVWRAAEAFGTDRGARSIWKSTCPMQAGLAGGLQMRAPPCVVSRHSGALRCPTRSAAVHRGGYACLCGEHACAHARDWRYP
jgi:hypothetical protein